MSIGDRDDDRLDGRQPQRERPGEMLDEDADEPLERAVDRPVDGDRPLGLALLVDVGQVESLREHRQVDLDRRHLPLAAECVVDVDVDLGRVERAILGLQLVADVGGSEPLLGQLLSALPERRVTDRLVWLRREREARCQTEPAVRLRDLAEQRDDLVSQLVWPDVQVRIVLDELPDAGQPRQRPRALVPMQPSELAEAQREIPVRPELRAVDVGRLGAVHRFQAERLVLRFDNEHVVAIQVPMARLPPELLGHHDGRRHLLVATARLKLAHGALERAPDQLPFRVPEG
jgi:hypothetical protein